MCALLQCSSTCAGGFQRRVVVCQDADGRSNSYCDERVKPAESKSCDSGPCPLWNYGVWGEVRFNLQFKTQVFVILFPLAYWLWILLHFPQNFCVSFLSSVLFCPLCLYVCLSLFHLSHKRQPLLSQRTLDL